MFRSVSRGAPRQSLKRCRSDLDDDDSTISLPTPARKRQRTCANQDRPIIKRPSSANLLSDAKLFLSDTDSSDIDMVDTDLDDSENEHPLRTPRATTKTYSALTSDTSGLYGCSSPSASSTSSCSLSADESMDSSLDFDSVDFVEEEESASILSLAKDESSVIYSFLQFADVIQMSKTCNRLHALSFKLLPMMTVRCKSLYGVGAEPLNMLIARCSSYLKVLDLSQVCTAVTDDTVRAIATHCSHVNVVSLHGCMALTDSAVIHLLKSCPFLRDLDLSGCHQLTGSIGEALSMCSRLQRVDLSWCNSMDADIVPYLLLMNERDALRHCLLHSTNRYVSLFMAFEECFAELERGRSTVHKLKCALTVTGGLQSKYTDDDALRRQIEYLKERNITFVDPQTAGLRGISEHDFKSKLDLLCSSTTVFSWRWYTQYSSNKVYLVMHTEFGIFGAKLIPLLDFTSSRKEFIQNMSESRRDPIEFLKSECDLEHWKWTADFQSKRTLSLLGMERRASWIRHTATQSCRPQNVLYRNMKAIDYITRTST